MRVRGTGEEEGTGTQWKRAAPIPVRGNKPDTTSLKGTTGAQVQYRCVPDDRAVARHLGYLLTALNFYF